MISGHSLLDKPDYFAFWPGILNYIYGSARSGEGIEGLLCTRDRAVCIGARSATGFGEEDAAGQRGINKWESDPRSKLFLGV